MPRTTVFTLGLAVVTSDCQGAERSAESASTVAEADTGVGAFWESYLAATKAGDATALDQLHTTDA